MTMTATSRSKMENSTIGDIDGMTHIREDTRLGQLRTIGMETALMAGKENTRDSQQRSIDEWEED